MNRLDPTFTYRNRSSKLFFGLICCCVLSLLPSATVAQELGQDDIDDFDYFEEGPWTDLERTTLVVPRVANGTVTLDGSASSGEYGGFQAVDLVPVSNAWVLNFPNPPSWDGPADSSTQFWLAHDDTYFYIGVDVTDDVVNVDDTSEHNWRDDSVEVFFDAQNYKYDVQSNDNSPYGGHDGIAADGNQRAWDYEFEEPNGFGNSQFATDVDWTNGPDGDVWAVGTETDRGYAVEMRYNKRLFEDPEIGNKLENDYVMGFNLAVDDEDGRGPGENGTGELDLDLEIAYYWSQRERLIDWTPDAAEDYTAEQIAAGEHEADFERMLDPNGRLRQGGMGEIIFSDTGLLLGDFNANGVLDAGDLDALAVATEAGFDVSFDVNKDGVLSAEDRKQWVEVLANTWFGDADLDGQFNSSDFVQVFGAAKYETGQDATWAEGDWNGDKLFNSSDFVSAFAGAGYEKGERPAPVGVPEPSGVMVLLLGMTAILRFRRFKLERSPA